MRLIAWLGIAATLWLLVVSSWLLMRWTVGAFQLPLTPLQLCLSAFGSSGLAAAVGASLDACAWTQRASWRRLVSVVLSISLVALAVALCIPGSSRLGLAILWASVAMTDIWLLLKVLRHDARGKHELHGKLDSPVGLHPSNENSETDPLSDYIDQRLTCGRDDTGRPFVQGVARARMSAGERMTHLHIAFCPPFELTPEVEVEQVSGPAADVRVGLTLPQGVRFDVKRLATADPDGSVVLAFYCQ
jgi:hypothetical protein